MTDTISKERRSANMSKIRATGMKPEMAVRQLVHSLGYRYRLHRKDLPGKPDLVFPARKKVIFVNGCFWHQHSEPSCKITNRPKSNQEYWLPKLKKNTQRDAQNHAKLHELGWDVLVIWECEVIDNTGLVERVQDYLS